MLKDPIQTLQKIQTSVLLMWGEKDRLISVSNAKDYSRELPRSETVTLPQLGHVPQEEAPAQSLPTARAFLVR